MFFIINHQQLKLEIRLTMMMLRFVMTNLMERYLLSVELNASGYIRRIHFLNDLLWWYYLRKYKGGKFAFTMTIIDNQLAS